MNPSVIYELTKKLNIISKNTDDQLIALIQKGDTKAFQILFEKYGKRLYQFSLKYLLKKEDAEDLLNEVFLKIWENKENLKTHTLFQSYLFTIAYNSIRQRFIKKSREEKYVKIFAEEYLLETTKNEDQFDYLLFVSAINKIIDLLPARRKEIFLLSYKDELKNKEIAEKLGLSEQFIKNQLADARKFIISKIKDNNQLTGIFFLFLMTEQHFD